MKRLCAVFHPAGWFHVSFSTPLSGSSPQVRCSLELPLGVLTFENMTIVPKGRVRVGILAGGRKLFEGIIREFTTVSMRERITCEKPTNLVLDVARTHSGHREFGKRVNVEIKGSFRPLLAGEEISRLCDSVSHDVLKLAYVAGREAGYREGVDVGVRIRLDEVPTELLGEEIQRRLRKALKDRIRVWCS